MAGGLASLVHEYTPPRYPFRSPIQMKPRYTIRTALVGTAAIAAVFGWYAVQRSERNDELRTMDVLRAELKNSFSVDEDELGLGGCGTWAGAVVHVEDCGPTFFRFLQADAFKRVVAIEVQHESNPKIVALLVRFPSLRSASFSNGVMYKPLTVPDDEWEFAGAVRLYGLLHPDVKVSHYGHEISAYEQFRMRPDLFGDDLEDPFAVNTDASLNDDTRLLTDDPFR